MRFIFSILLQRKWIKVIAGKSNESVKLITNREDFTLTFQRDWGGLFKPSEDLVIVCKIAERIIRVEQAKGVFS